MEQELVGQLGPDAKYDVAYKDGVASVSVEYAGKYAAASAKVSVPAKVLLQPFADKLKAAIPGGIDDAIIDAIIAGL